MWGGTFMRAVDLGGVSRARGFNLQGYANHLYAWHCPPSMPIPHSLQPGMKGSLSLYHLQVCLSPLPSLAIHGEINEARVDEGILIYEVAFLFHRSFLQGDKAPGENQSTFSLAIVTLAGHLLHSSARHGPLFEPRSGVQVEGGAAEAAGHYGGRGRLVLPHPLPRGERSGRRKGSELQTRTLYTWFRGIESQNNAIFADIKNNFLLSLFFRCLNL